MTSPWQGIGRHSFQLIDGRGVFNHERLRNFTRDTNMSNRGVDYAVIAIIGPQSSGKSTFLNHLVGTNFRQMDSLRGRNKTTQGIWMSNCVNIQGKFMIAMDIEGTDGRERGEDDTTFEGKSALFAVAMADVLFINLWCHDIGRQQASCIPLLQTVLQIRIKMQMDRSRKIKLCFILRDITTTPVERLGEAIMRTMRNIWTTITRTNGFRGTNINDFFQVQVFALPNYETQRKQFEDKVAEIRERTLSVHREGVVPGIAFQENAGQLWKTIKEEPFLNLPAHSDLIAEHMCKEIAEKRLEIVASSKVLMELKKEVAAGLVTGFGDRLHFLMEATLAKYSSEAQHFKELKVSERRRVLRSKILEIFYPLYVTMLGHARNKTFQEFKNKLTELLMGRVAFVGAYKESYNSCKGVLEDQCKDVVKKLSPGRWLNLRYSTEVRKLYRDMENYASSIRSHSISKLQEKYKNAVSGYITKWLDQPQDLTGDTYWGWIGEVIRMSTSKDNGGPLSNLSSEVATYSEDKSLSDRMIQNLKTYARNEFLRKLKKEDDKRVVEHMINRFGAVMCDRAEKPLDNKKEVTAAARTARTEAMKLLSVMAVAPNDRTPNDDIRKRLFESLMDSNSSTTCCLDTDKHEGVSEDDTILAPWKCKILRSRFDKASDEILENVLADVNKIRWEQGKEFAIRLTRHVSTGVALVATPIAGILGAIFAGDFTFLLGAVSVGAFFETWVKYLKKEKDKARQRVIELQKRHLQYLQKPFARRSITCARV